MCAVAVGSGAIGCGSQAPEELPAAAGVPTSPALSTEPEGRVTPVGARPEGIVADPGSGLAAVSLGAVRLLALVRISSGEIVGKESYIFVGAIIAVRTSGMWMVVKVTLSPIVSELATRVNASSADFDAT